MQVNHGGIFDLSRPSKGGQAVPRQGICRCAIRNLGTQQATVAGVCADTVAGEELSGVIFLRGGLGLSEGR